MIVMSVGFSFGPLGPKAVPTMKTHPLRLACAAAMLAASAAHAQFVSPLPPVPFPSENPFSEAKRVLGKALFWDEQLSSNSTVACATCHSPSHAGVDSRRVRSPGPDHLLNTADDTFGSPGIVRINAEGKYEVDPVYGVGPQSGARASISFLTASYAPRLFWDGRAKTSFTDPLTLQTLIPVGGALESQAVGPVMNPIEMAHENRNWVEVATKLAAARPLALARNIQPDVAAALVGVQDYPQLFATAFGDGAITPARIGMAIATYERTLYPDETPWDAFNDGDLDALTPQQAEGWTNFDAVGCTLCHFAPEFTDNDFHAIGFRPPTEDLGVGGVNGNAADNGKFRTPSLRNAGLRSNFMHNGNLETLDDVIAFYARAEGAAPQFSENQDVFMDFVIVPTEFIASITDFLTNGLIDPRVRDGLPPFDSATLWSSRLEDHVQSLPGGVAGAGGLPTMIAPAPPLVGNSEFTLGLANARGGAEATLFISRHAPSAGVLTADRTLGPITLPGTTPTDGITTITWPIAANGALLGKTVYFQWAVTDPTAPDGIARSAPAAATFFCGDIGCPTTCFADLDDGLGGGFPDGAVNIDDLLYYLQVFGEGSLDADLDDGSNLGTPDQAVTIDDLLFFIDRFSAGC